MDIRIGRVSYLFKNTTITSIWNIARPYYISRPMSTPVEMADCLSVCLSSCLSNESESLSFILLSSLYKSVYSLSAMLVLLMCLSFPSSVLSVYLFLHFSCLSCISACLSCLYVNLTRLSVQQAYSSHFCVIYSSLRASYYLYTGKVKILLFMRA